MTGSLKTYIKKRWIQPLYVTWHKTKTFISQFKNLLFFPITLLYIRIYEVITGTMCLDKLSFNTKNSWWNTAELNWSKIMKDCFQAEMVEENNENTSLARKKKTIPQDNIVASSSAAPPPQQIWAQRGNQKFNIKSNISKKP